jgi:predicted dehydrogenase
MYEAGIIGCGFIAIDAPDSHAQAYVDNPNIKLTCFIDTDAKKAVKAYEKYNISHFIFDTGTGFAPTGTWPTKFDIASICTPIGDGLTKTRFHRVMDAVRSHGAKAILLEKPIAATLDGADTIIEYCKHWNVLLVVNHQRRFINPKFTFSRGILNTGTHAFDLIRKLFGEISGVYIDHVTCISGQRIDIEYKDSMVGEFNLDCTRSTERMIPKVVEYIVGCLDTGDINQDLAIEARRDLEICLQYQELFSKK